MTTDASEKQTILIVDDNPTNLSVLSLALKGAGYTIAVATDGEDAIEQVEYSPPQLILLDVMMPGIDGFETCQRLQESPASRSIPIIFMTALADPVDKVKGLSLGAVDYITKPFQQEEVLARVGVHLQLRNLTRALESQNDRLKEEIRQRETAQQTLQQTLQELRTAQKQIVAQEKLASLGTLTAGVAHELRNPLNFVNNYAESSVEIAEEVLAFLREDNSVPAPESIAEVKELLVDLKDNAAAIHHHGKRAETIVQNMLMHARSDGGKRQIANLNVLVRQAIGLAYQSLRSQDPDFGIHIETKLDPQAGEVDLVPSDISRALINLLENACYALRNKQKSNREFAPQLQVSTRRADGKVEICIRDNGDGIPPEIQDRIFNPFFTTKPTGEGTGLGLSIAYDIIVGQHRGTLALDTSPGAYAEFAIALPAPRTPEIP